MAEARLPGTGHQARRIGQAICPVPIGGLGGEVSSGGIHEDALERAGPPGKKN